MYVRHILSTECPSKCDPVHITKGEYMITKSVFTRNANEVRTNNTQFAISKEHNISTEGQHATA